MRPNIKKCFTINPMRKTEDFNSYEELIKKGLFNGIEIFYPYQLNKEEFKTYTDNVERIHKNYSSLEIVMHLPYGKGNDLCGEDYKEVLQREKDGIKYTSLFGTKKLTLHLGEVKDKENREKYIVHIVKVLKELCDYAAIYNMNIMIENMPGDGELGFSPEEILDIITRTNKDNLKFILDTGHAHVSKYESKKYIQVLGKYLYHMHFSDNDSSSDQHKPIGTGNIDFREIFDDLDKIQYNELHCLEILFKTTGDLYNYVNDMNRVSK